MFHSKTDEKTAEESLGFLLPQHEYFHQSMVVADCESELFRDSSRGLEGGAFFVATILNRKEAKTQKGKDAIDSLKDFILLKSDARFCHYVIKKFELDPNTDNTPYGIKSAKYEDKEAFVNRMVEEALRDLLPYFKDCKFEDPQLQDHPLQEGRRGKYQTPREHIRTKSAMQQMMQIEEDVVMSTTQQVQTNLSRQEFIEQNMQKISSVLSGTRSKIVFSCKLCSFQSKHRTICITHIETCLDENREPLSTEQPAESITSLDTSLGSAETEEKEPTIVGDMFWNYKNGEFLLDALFSITAAYERVGDGLGCYIINKVLLPIFHGLKHSNYSSTVHRFITRVLCEATPKEALKLIHERFSNRVGRPGHNIHRDRRMEYRIGATKKLIGNLGANFGQEAVQQVNCSVDIKEELFLRTRTSHGVNIRNVY